MRNIYHNPTNLHYPFFASLLAVIFSIKGATQLSAQDSLKHKVLKEVEIGTQRGRNLRFMKPVQGMTLTAGKKNEIIPVASLDANLTANTARQVFANIPGLMIWENDGSGLQVNVATRGLSPNRSWEFNVRQNGYDISSDVFGYPEAYFQPTFEALERIELIRGAAGLQFGPQFGGLLNYVLKGPSQKRIAYEGNQTGGSYGLLGSYNRVSGTIGKWTYNSYVQYRQADGWRQNSAYSTYNAFGQVGYQLTDRIKLTAEITQSNYWARQAGGLTDAMYLADPRQSNRPRNWFNVPWTVPAITLDWQLAENTKLQLKSSAVFGQRNSVGNIRTINFQDTSTQARTLQQDVYRNYSNELRVLHQYRLLGQLRSTLATGLRHNHVITSRRNGGTGTTGSDFDMSQVKPYSTDLLFKTWNTAAFAENQFALTSRWTLTPGVRFESIGNSGVGRTALTTAGAFNQPRRDRSFVLFGLSTEYKMATNVTFYASYTQNYRPVLYSDLTQNAANNAIIDPNLKDAKGAIAEVGIRGSLREFLDFDVSAFRVDYSNRVGTYTQPVTNLLVRTNIGNSVSQGIETWFELRYPPAIEAFRTRGQIFLSNSLSLIDARYTRWDVPTGVASINGRWVENAPGVTLRTSLGYRMAKGGVTVTRSQVSKIYTDANNTTASANGNTGVVPGYQVWDLSASYQLSEIFGLRFSVNNLTDARYFTRRSAGYPGPGLLPADARSFVGSLTINL